jgi:hypothetical protein
MTHIEYTHRTKTHLFIGMELNASAVLWSVLRINRHMVLKLSFANIDCEVAAPKTQQGSNQ